MDRSKWLFSIATSGELDHEGNEDYCVIIGEGKYTVDTEVPTDKVVIIKNQLALIIDSMQVIKDTL